MPAIFMQGSQEIIFSGPEDNVLKIMNEVDSGWAGVSVSYESSEGVPSEFDFMIKDLVSGEFKLEKVDGNKIKAIINGVLKTSVQRDAFDDLVAKGLPWKISCVTGGYSTIGCLESVSGDAPKLLKKAPKV